MQRVDRYSYEGSFVGGYMGKNTMKMRSHWILVPGISIGSEISSSQLKCMPVRVFLSISLFNEPVRVMAIFIIL